MPGEAMEQPSNTGGNGNHAANGRFVPGNRASKGNPHLVRVCKLRSLLLEAVTDEDFGAVVKKLLDAAKGGDLASIKELLDRLLGKAPAAIELTGADGEPLNMSSGAIRGAILEALSPFPEARVAVAMKLRALGTNGSDN